MIMKTSLLKLRGLSMHKAVPAGLGAMAALLKLPDGKLDALLEEAAQGEIVSAANLNSPDQVVIAGHAGAVKRAIELAKAAGLIGCVRRTPNNLSTNRRHFEGFGKNK